MLNVRRDKTAAIFPVAVLPVFLSLILYWWIFYTFSSPQLFIMKYFLLIFCVIVNSDIIQNRMIPETLDSILEGTQITQNYYLIFFFSIKNFMTIRDLFQFYSKSGTEKFKQKINQSNFFVKRNVIIKRILKNNIFCSILMYYLLGLQRSNWMI